VKNNSKIFGVSDGGKANVNQRFGFAPDWLVFFTAVTGVVTQRFTSLRGEAWRDDPSKPTDWLKINEYKMCTF